jgi:hypothetical protein
MRISFPLPAVRPSLPSWLVVLVVIALAAYMAYPAIQGDLSRWNSEELPSWIGKLPDQAVQGEKICDIDTRLIHTGFLQAHTWRDTLRWWTGTWVGQVPFYRPLTSYLFYTQWRLWGDYEHRYHFVAVVTHLIAVVAYSCLTLALMRHFRVPYPRFGALFAGIVFAHGLSLLPDQISIVSEVFGAWKNQPDSLALLFFSLTLIAYIRLREGASGRLARVMPTVWYILSCLTKEAGVLQPLLLPLLEWDRLRAGGESRREAIRHMAPLFAILVVYLPYRALCLKTAVGYQYGSNDSWFQRMVMNLTGGFSGYLVYADWGSFLMTLLPLSVIGIVWWRKRTGKAWSRRTFGIFAVGVTSAILLIALIFAHHGDGGLDPIVGLMLMGRIRTLLSVTASATFLLLASLAFMHARQLAVFAYGWALLILALTLFSPSVLHRYYLMNAGFAILLATGASLLAAYLSRVWKAYQTASKTVVSTVFG